MQVLLAANDNLVQVIGLKNEATEAYVNDATVTARVRDRSGVDVPGQVWPLTLDYVSGTDGNYQGVLDSALAVSLDEIVDVDLVADGAGLHGEWSVPARVVDRKS